MLSGADKRINGNIDLYPTPFNSRNWMVIGHGLIGLFIAHELAVRGFSVTLMGKGGTDGKASRAAGGILSPLYPWRYSAPVTRLAAWSQSFYRQFLPALTDTTGVDSELEQSGLLMLGDLESHAPSWAREFGAALDVVADTAIARIEPAIAADETAGVWMREIAHVRSPRLLRALRALLAQRNVDIREGVTVHAIKVQGDRVVGLETSHGEVATECCVVAAGAWSTELLQGTGVALPVEPVRGQMIAFETAPGFLRRIVMKDGVYAIPRRDGLVVVGSTLEHVGFNPSTTLEAAASLKDAVTRFIPGLDRFPVVHHWAGLRPSSPNDVPFIGAHPYIKGLYVNTGHYRNGIVMAPASARLLGDIMFGRPPIVDPRPYALPTER